MVNVDGGNAPTRPEQPGTLRPLRRFTWMTVIALVALLLLWATTRGVDREREAGTTPSAEQETPRQNLQPE